MPENESVFAERPLGGGTRDDEARAVRVVTSTARVGLSAVRPNGRLRLDALAGFVQDVADDDAATSPTDDDGVWVLRRSTFRIQRNIAFREVVQCFTWCSATGARWAERRTDVDVGATRRVEVAALWVHVDRATGRPLRLPAHFDAVWGASVVRTGISAKLRHDDPPRDAASTSWTVRATDLDVLDHVNNAAYWAPVEEELARRGQPRVREAEVEFRAGVGRGECPEIVTVDTEAGFAQWWRVGGEVRASVRVACAPRPEDVTAEEE